MATARLSSDNSFQNLQHDKEKERMHTVLLASCIAALAQVNFGYALGFTSQFTPQRARFDQLSDRDLSIFASLVAVGAMVGCLLAGVLVDRIGRKPTILCTALFYTPGWLLIAYSDESKTLLFLGRIITGIGVGISSLVVPLYITEVSSEKTRGSFGNINQLFVVLGLFTAFTCGLFESVSIIALIPVGITLFSVSLTVCIPETPRWLLANHKHQEAILALSWFRGNHYQVQAECFEIESSLGFVDPDEVPDTWDVSDLRGPTFLRPIVIAVALMFFQQFCGINCIIFYCTIIFQKSGIDKQIDLAESSQEVSLFVCSAMLAFTIVSCALVDRIGRRTLFLIGSVAMTIVLFLLGVYFYHVSCNLKLQHSHRTFGIIVFAAILVYIACYSIGWGPLPWLLMSEFFPLKMRGLASSVVTFSNWLFVFLTTVIFNPDSTEFDACELFFLFGSLTFLGLIFVLFCVPETQGKLLEDVMFIFINRRIWRMNRPCGGGRFQQYL